MFWSVRPICSAIDMKRLLKTSSMTGSAAVPTARPGFARRGAGEDEMVPRGDGGSPAGLDDDGLVRLDEEGRPVDDGARRETVAA